MTGPSSVLARLRTDLPADLLLPTPPPVPVLTGDFADFSLRICDPGPDDATTGADAELVAGWMSRPHLVETWEQPWSAARWAAD